MTRATMMPPAASAAAAGGIFFGTRRETFLAECCRRLEERLAVLFAIPVSVAPAGAVAAAMTPLASAATAAAGMDGPDGAGEMAGGPARGASGVTATGALSAGAERGQFALFFEENSAAALAGALMGTPPESPEAAIAALTPLAQEIAAGLAVAAEAVLGGAASTVIESLRWSDDPPVAGAERGGIRLALGGVEALVSLELTGEPAAREEAGREPARPSDVLLDLELPFALRLGSVEMELGEIQAVEQGTVIPLGRAADSAVSLVVGGRVIARGELVVVDGCFGIQIQSVETAERRLTTLGRV